MSLTSEQEQVVYNEARNVWLQTHSSAFTTRQMESDREFVTLLRIGRAYLEEQNRLRAAAAHSDMRQDATTSSTTERAGTNRSDTAIATCPNATHIRDVAQSMDCEFNTLSVHKEGDTNRVYRSNSADMPQLSVVAGHHHSPANLQCRLSSARVNCDFHHQSVWNLIPALTNADFRNNSSLDFSLTSRSELNPFINNNILPIRQRVVASTCNKTSEVEVLVYPDWSLEGILGFRFNRNRSGRWNFAISSLSLEVTSDGHTEAYELNFFRTVLQRIADFMNLTAIASEILHDITHAPVEWEIMPPNAELSINTGWQENLNDLQCGYYVNASLGFSPLIGITWEIDLGETALRAIMASAPPVYAAYQSISSLISVSEFIQITLRIESVINYEFTLHYNTTNGEYPSPDGGVEGVITIQFEITLTPERITRALGINCEISAGVETGITIQARGPLIDRNGGFISLQANFNGATLYAGIEFSMGTSSTRPAERPAPSARTERRGVRRADEDDDGSASTEHRYIIYEERQLGVSRIAI